MSQAGWPRTVRALAKAAGASVEMTGGTHFRIIHPSGWRVIAPYSPSDRRARANLRSAIRRAQRGAAR